MDFNWPLINNNISQTDREVLADFCLNGERFTNGPKVKEFEQYDFSDRKQIGFIAQEVKKNYS